MQVWSLGEEDPLQEKMATHSSILAWRIPWTEEPGRLQYMGLQSQTWLHSWTCNHFFNVETRLSIYNAWYPNMIILTIRKPMLREMVTCLNHPELELELASLGSTLELLFFQSQICFFLASLRIKFPLLFSGCCSQRKTIFFNHPDQWENFTYFHTGPQVMKLR